MARIRKRVKKKSEHLLIRIFIFERILMSAKLMLKICQYKCEH